MARSSRTRKTSRAGDGLIEYFLIAVLIAIGTMAAMTAFGSSVSDSYDRISTKVDEAMPAN